MARKRKAPAERVVVRATVSLSGFPAGKLAVVDPTDPWIASAIEARWLIIEPGVDVPPQLQSD